MLFSRLRPLSRRLTTHSTAPSSSAVPSPDFSLEDQFDSDEEDPEDVFTSFLPHLFPDDAPECHGDPGQHLLYSSPRYGELDIMVPSYPSQSQTGERPEEIDEDEPCSVDQGNQIEQGRKLFAHYLWSAALVVAEGLELADSGLTDGDGEMWKLKGEKVLELGAGAGLPSIVAAFANASAVTITDHPSSPALDPSGAIAFNVKHNLSSGSNCAVDIRPHKWGTLSSDPWAISNKGLYTRIIAADCCWKGSQHGHILDTIKWFLAPTGKVWVVSGFHTGRPIVARFFEAAMRVGLEIERVYERDLSTSVQSEGGEVRRQWVNFREGEGMENRRRWCVTAVLKRASSSST